MSLVVVHNTFNFRKSLEKDTNQHVIDTHTENKEVILHPTPLNSVGMNSTNSSFRQKINLLQFHPFRAKMI